MYKPRNLSGIFSKDDINKFFTNSSGYLFQNISKKFLHKFLQKYHMSFFYGTFSSICFRNSSPIFFSRNFIKGFLRVSRKFLRNTSLNFFKNFFGVSSNIPPEIHSKVLPMFSTVIQLKIS